MTPIPVTYSGQAGCLLVAILNVGIVRRDQSNVAGGHVIDPTALVVDPSGALHVAYYWELVVDERWLHNMIGEATNWGGEQGEGY